MEENKKQSANDEARRIAADVAVVTMQMENALQWRLEAAQQSFRTAAQAAIRQAQTSLEQLNAGNWVSTYGTGTKMDEAADNLRRAQEACNELNSWIGTIRSELNGLR